MYKNGQTKCSPAHLLHYLILIRTTCDEEAWERESRLAEEIVTKQRRTGDIKQSRERERERERERDEQYMYRHRNRRDF